ncbi:MAG: nucleotidyl transferase AbiEii/AbiGii toxin family protein [Nitrosopumilaceae archaeon]|nr:nucleotidyl transferase AbiEii/AbiGii toxin family protein [Nitrosopumilaceae archaeon]
MYHFNDELQKNNIKKITSKLHFHNPKYVEKFIMDFEINYHISQKINSILRGGMCVPFHTQLGVRRLSIDIDLLTSLQLDEINSMMKGLDDSLPDVHIKLHKPKRPAPIPNLVTYYIEYTSCFGQSDTVKVDYLCDVQLQLPTQNITTTQEIIDFKINYNAKILTRGALIGDKITTLALRKIGLPKPQNGNFSDDLPKQIYDIATLLKSATEKDIDESLEVFMTLTAFKVQIYDNGKYEVQEILDTILFSIKSLLSFDSQITNISEYVGIFGSFKGTYLNTVQSYKKTEHLSDILLVWSYVIFLKNFFDDSTSKIEIVKKIYNSIERYQKIIDYDVDDKKTLRDSLMNNMPTLPFNQNILHQTPVEQIFLVKEIFSN